MKYIQQIAQVIVNSVLSLLLLHLTVD